METERIMLEMKDYVNGLITRILTKSDYVTGILVVDRSGDTVTKIYPGTVQFHDLRNKLLDSISNKYSGWEDNPLLAHLHYHGIMGLDYYLFY